MTSSHVNSKRDAPADAWLAAPSLSDPNAALWNSLRPTGRPSWLVSLRRQVESFSLLNPVRQLLPSSWQSGGGATRWVFAGALTVCAGAGLSLLGRAVVAPSHDPASGLATPAAESRTPSGVAAVNAVPTSDTRTRLGATEFGVVGLAAPRAAAPVPAEATVIHSLSPSDLALSPADPSAKAKSASSAKKKARAAARRRAAKNRRNAGLSATLP